MRCVCVGGDHSISLPILRAVGKKHGPVSLIQFDAHNDLWDEYFGSKYSHGTPFRRAFGEGLLLDGGVLQVGLRGQVYGEDDFDFARAHKVRMVTAEEFHKKGLVIVQRHLRAFRGKPVYVTLDIDVVDPAYMILWGREGLMSHEVAVHGIDLLTGEVIPAIKAYQADREKGRRSLAVTR